MNMLQISGTIGRALQRSIEQTYTTCLEVLNPDTPGRIERHSVRFMVEPDGLGHGCRVIINGSLRCSLEQPSLTEIRVSDFMLMTDC